MQTTEIITAQDPKSPVAEAYRTLRTNIQFSSTDEKLQVIALTSSGPGEGKSTTAANLAVAMATSGNRTILIDSDLRKPRLHKIFKCSNHKGLSNLLIGETKFDSIAYKTDIENLYILTSGTKPPNPSELIGSAKMQRFIVGLKENFDYIIIDTPPVIAVTDAQIISKYSDGFILVVASGQADKQAAIKAKDLLDKVNAKILGVVLNKVDMKNNKHGYGTYYSYYVNKVDMKNNKHGYGTYYSYYDDGTKKEKTTKSKQ